MLHYSRYVVAGVLVLGLIASGSNVKAEDDPAQKFAGQTPDTTVAIDEVQIGYLVIGTLGGGTLHYQGNDYRLKSWWAGRWAVGANKLKASGEVYGLKDPTDLAEEYLDACVGVAATVKGGGIVVEEWQRGPQAPEDAP